jgi:hypothetical protein
MEDGNRTSNKPALEQSRLSRASCLAHFQEETQNNRAKGEEKEEEEDEEAEWKSRMKRAGVFCETASFRPFIDGPAMRKRIEYNWHFSLFSKRKRGESRTHIKKFPL